MSNGTPVMSGSLVVEMCGECGTSGYVCAVCAPGGSHCGGCDQWISSDDAEDHYAVGGCDTDEEEQS